MNLINEYEEKLLKMETMMETLTKKLEAVQAENVLLKELALQSEQRYEQIKQLERQNEELQRQISELTNEHEDKKMKGTEEEQGDSWFIHTLKHQNAPIRATEQKPRHPLSTPFTFGENKK
jgi:chromosome segregation ATPase